MPAQPVKTNAATINRSFMNERRIGVSRVLR
jgi:hypothetical protein